MTSTILVVDDDPDIRTVLRLVLEDEGFAVVEARDGAEGLLQVETYHPCLLLLDLNMPHVTGWELYRQLERHGTLPPTLIMTAGQQAAAEARALHAAGSLAKPFDLDTVLTAVEKILGAGS